MKRQTILSVLLAVSAVAAFAQAPVEITSEPSHHLVLENASVRVFAVTVNPGASTLVHRHAHDYIAVTLGDAEILNAKAGAEPVTVTFKDGDARFSAGGLVHAVTNKGARPFRNVTIELLGPTTGEHACTASCSQPVPCDSPNKALCPTAEELLASDQWTVMKVTLPGGGHRPRHTHAGPFLVVPLTNVEFKETDEFGTVDNVRLAVGQATWAKPVTHETVNVLSQPARLVILQFKGAPAAAPPASSVPKTK
jgi:quercetin dioxygenase-like cupin family protein